MVVVDSAYVTIKTSTTVMGVYFGFFCVMLLTVMGLFIWQCRRGCHLTRHTSVVEEKTMVNNATMTTVTYTEVKGAQYPRFKHEPRSGGCW